VPEYVLIPTFNFRVQLFRSQGDDGPELLGDGGFQEVTGLEVEMDVQDLDVGGANDRVVRRVGRARFQPLVLKRGMFAPDGEESDGTADDALWRWLQDVVSGVRPVRRYDGAVEVLDQARDLRTTWRFQRGLPAKVVGPALNARSGEVAVEELHISHEGLTLEGTV
jgi:phage tail-like protein